MLDKTTRSEDFPADAVVKTVVERIAAHEKQSIRLKFKSCFLNNGEVLNAIEKNGHMLQNGSTLTVLKQSGLPAEGHAGAAECTVS